MTTPLSPSDSLNMPKSSLLFGKYRIEEKIAQGAQATIYKATCLKTGRLVALKVGHTFLLSNGGAKRLEREFRILKKLEDIETVIRPFHWFHKDKLYGFSMEWVEGLAGNEWIRKGGFRDWQSWLWLARNLLGTLDECHKRSILHRDCKPHNILLSERGSLTLIDFGVARTDRYIEMSDADLRQGTMYYLPPEQLDKGNATISGELYAAGITLYEFLLGRLPFTAEEAQDIQKQKSEGRIILPTRLNPDLPKYLDVWMARMLAPDPVLRPQGAREALGLLLHPETLGIDDAEESRELMRRCSRCEAPLWQPLPFCTHCGASFKLEPERGTSSVVLLSVKNPDEMPEKIEKKFQITLRPFSRYRAQSAYPAVLVRNITGLDAQMIRSSFEDNDTVALVTNRPYMKLFPKLRLNPMQIFVSAFLVLFLFINIVYALKMGLGNPLMLSFVLLSLAGVAYSVLRPILLFSELRLRKQSLNWQDASRIRSSLERLTRQSSRQRASQMVRRTYGLIREINRFPGSEEVRKQMKSRTGDAIVESIDLLALSDRLEREFSPVSIEKISRMIASLERQLDEIHDPKKLSKGLARREELKRQELGRIAIERKKMNAELRFGVLASEINQLWRLSRERDLEKFTPIMHSLERLLNETDPKLMEGTGSLSESDRDSYDSQQNPIRRKKNTKTERYTLDFSSIVKNKIRTYGDSFKAWKTTWTGVESAPIVCTKCGHFHEKGSYRCKHCRTVIVPELSPKRIARRLASRFMLPVVFATMIAITLWMR